MITPAAIALFLLAGVSAEQAQSSKVTAPPTGAVDQLTRPISGRALLGDVNKGVPERPNTSMPQLSVTEGTVRAPSPISQGQDRRIVQTKAIGGLDQCDPAFSPPGALAPVCEQTIETRSAEFDNADEKELSPEQRLLAVGQQQNGGIAEIGAARRAAEDPNSSAAQGLASIVLPAPREAQPPEVDPATGLTREAIAVITAIIKGE